MVTEVKTSISIFEDPNHERPKIDQAYPVNCSSQMLTYRCRLFISALHGDAPYHMDFFVIPGAENTISGSTFQGVNLFRLSFPIPHSRSESMNMPVPQVGPPPFPPSSTTPLDSLLQEDERVDYNSEMAVPDDTVITQDLSLIHI